jgi:hypothetical protein
MSRLDQLPPDQKAALSLLLGRRESYAKLASLLNIGERAVRDRAHSALAVLAPREARMLSAERRRDVGDYVLGQQSEQQRLATRRLLESSPEALAWARALAAELSSVSDEPLRALPAQAGPATPRSDDAAAPATLGSPADPARASPAAASPAPRASRPAPSPPLTQARVPIPFGERTASLPSLPPSSRRAGAVLLAALVAGVIAALVLILDSGSSSSHKHPKATAGTSATGTQGQASGTQATRTKEDKRITLRPPSGSRSRALGVAEVLSEGSKYAFYMAAEGLQPTHGFFYAVWLYNSPTDAEALSKSPPVGSDGRLQGGALLPSNAGRFHRMLLTRESSERPTRPGPIVLSGAFGLR